MNISLKPEKPGFVYMVRPRKGEGEAFCECPALCILCAFCNCGNLKPYFGSFREMVIGTGLRIMSITGDVSMTCSKSSLIFSLGASLLSLQVT